MNNSLTICITGAGGTVGRLLVEHYLRNPQVTIKAIERSEMAMAELLATFQNNPRLEPILADLLDAPSFQGALTDCDVVIHCAALKHVLIGKQFPERQAYENVTAFYNLIRAARGAKVQKFLLCSTDKAAQPTGVMGATKHLLEFICRDAATPTFATGAVRFANILGSNGSLLHVIQNRLKDGGDITLRDPRMTRYFLRAPEVVELIDYALTHIQNGEIFTRDTPTARIQDVIEVAFEHYGIPEHRLRMTTQQTQENTHERLISPDEVYLTRKASHYFIVRGTHGATLTQVEQERALSSSTQNLSKNQIRTLLYGN